MLGLLVRVTVQYINIILTLVQCVTRTQGFREKYKISQNISLVFRTIFYENKFAKGSENNAEFNANIV